MLDSTPRNAHKEDGSASEEQHCADPVRLLELLSKWELCYRSQSDKDEGEHESEETEREVDVEAPTPCRVLNEGTSNDRSDDGPYGPSTQDNGEVLGAVSQRHEITEDDLGEGNDPSTTDTLHTAANEHHREVIRDSTDYCSDREECE